LGEPENHEKESTMIKSLHCIVSGKVQGVNFRADTQSYASSLGLNGWVRNLHDGKVEVLAQGPDDKLEELKKYLLRGPSFSLVENLQTETIEYDKAYKGFEIR
jgi:acylphosphatase